MKRTELALTLIIALVTSTVAGYWLLKPYFPKTITVPDDYPTIQEAIDNASAGDTVFVKKGTHYSPSSGSPIIIDKPLSLIGEDPQDTVINGNYDKFYPKNWDRITIRVGAPDVTISGFTITNCEISIRLVNIALESLPTDCRIIGNNFVNDSHGIDVERANNLLISGNRITGYLGWGIRVSSSNIVITANNITEKNTGITLSPDSRNVTISGNNILRNKFGLNIEGDGPIYVYKNSITDNAGYGIQFSQDCNNSAVYNNDIERNNIGIKLEHDRLTGNIFGSGNTVYHNNLVDNSQQVFVEKTDRNAANLEEYTDVNGTAIVLWDNGEKGNYWNDYQTRYPDVAEVGTSGIGDTPYVIDENNTDHHPLMQQVDICTNSTYTLSCKSINGNCDCYYSVSSCHWNISFGLLQETQTLRQTVFEVSVQRITKRELN